MIISPRDVILKISEIVLLLCAKVDFMESTGIFAQ